MRLDRSTPGSRTTLFTALASRAGSRVVADAVLSCSASFTCQASRQGSSDTADPYFTGRSPLPASVIFLPPGCGGEIDRCRPLAAAAAQGHDLADAVLGMQDDHPLPEDIGIDLLCGCRHHSTISAAVRNPGPNFTGGVCRGSSRRKTGS